MNIILNKLQQISAAIMMLGAFTLVIFVISMFSTANSSAEVSVSPDSYITDGEKVKLVKGRPEYIDGKKVEYQTLHTIPIKPQIKTTNGTQVNVPEKLLCTHDEAKKGSCSRVLRTK